MYDKNSADFNELIDSEAVADILGNKYVKIDTNQDIFEVNGIKFEGLINVAKDGNKKTFYDITKIKRISQNRSTSANAFSTSLTNSNIVYHQLKTASILLTILCNNLKTMRGKITKQKIQKN